MEDECLCVKMQSCIENKNLIIFRSNFYACLYIWSCLLDCRRGSKQIAKEFSESIGQITYLELLHMLFAKLTKFIFHPGAII